MNKELKKRWKKVCTQIQASGLKQNFIASEMGISKNTLSLYTQEFKDEPVHKTYVTESMTSRLEDYFKTNHETQV